MSFIPLSVFELNNSELPRVLHHDGEVVVAINRAAHALIVVAKLFEGHDAVGLLAVPLGHEFLKDLVRALLSILDLRVLASVIDLSDVL